MRSQSIRPEESFVEASDTSNRGSCYFGWKRLLFVTTAILVGISCDYYGNNGGYTPCPSGFYGGEHWCEGDIIMTCYETSVDWEHHYEVHEFRDCRSYPGFTCHAGKCQNEDIDCGPGEEFCMDDLVINCNEAGVAEIESDCAHGASSEHCIIQSDSDADASVSAVCD